ncbi:MAG TPA: VTT domain-containing protein [Pyrinomonadaceae bacterium]|nr:VTT domain-containing protein [Pyrinomonadaceae bacterium]HMP65146.1 VTT domain-containing protein [Pyrinomonadaceae bacterium]
MIAKIRKHLSDLGRLTPMALVVTFMPMVGSATLLAFLIPIGHWLRDNWESGIPVFIAGTLFFCGLALLPTNVIGIVSGWAFGFGLGILVLMVGVVGSAFISFVINSRFSGRLLPEVASKNPKTSAVYNALLQERFWKTTLIIFLLRVSVIMPFAFTNFLMASARVPVRSYLLGTAAGMLPRSSAMVFVGAGLSELNLQNTRETYILVLGIAATVLSVIVIAYLSRRALEHITSEDAVPQPNQAA